MKFHGVFLDFYGNTDQSAATIGLPVFQDLFYHW